MSSKYEIKIVNKVDKQVRDLLKTQTPAFKRRFLETLEILADNPYVSPEDGRRYRPKKLTNGHWAVRIDLNHRMEFAIAGQIVHIISVADRRDAYKA